MCSFVNSYGVIMGLYFLMMLPKNILFLSVYTAYLKMQTKLLRFNHIPIKMLIFLSQEQKLGSIDFKQNYTLLKGMISLFHRLLSNLEKKCID